MPTWSNTDAPNAKPKFDYERQTRDIVQLKLGLPAYVGNTTITLSYSDGISVANGGSNVANVGVAAGQYLYFFPNGFGAPGGTTGNGYPGMFFSNNTVQSISGNVVTLTAAIFANNAVGVGIEFDKAIPYPSTKTVEKTYNQDTILVTATRISNNAVNLGNMTVGWNQIRKKTNNDGTVRYIHETLVALASPTAANVYSGNTSWGVAYTGL
jgi:hypothetical protein